MTLKTNVLVVANRTVDSPELLDALRTRALRGPVAYTLVVPVSGDRVAAAVALEASLARIRDAGVEIEGRLGDGDPLIAVQEAWNPSHFDEVIVSTLPTASSRWLRIDLPHRAARITGASVTHVVAGTGVATRQPAAL